MQHPVMDQQDATAPVERKIDAKWWYYLNQYTLAQKRQILMSYVIGSIAALIGTLVPELRLPTMICIGVFGLTSTGKSALINTCLQHQEDGATKRQIVAPEGDGKSGVKTLRLGFHKFLQSRAQFIDLRGFNGLFTEDDLKELNDIGLGKLANVQREIYRQNDTQAPMSLIDITAKKYSHIHVPLVCLAANANAEQQASISSIILGLKRLGFSNVVLVVTKRSLDVKQAEDFKQNGFAGIPPDDIYLLDNYPTDEVKSDPKAEKRFLREQEEQALDIMLACITKAEFNGLYKEIDINMWALVKQYYGKVTDKIKAYDVKCSLSTMFLATLLLFVALLLSKLWS